MENGRIFLAQPPLYKLKRQRSEPEFAYSDRERDGLLETGRAAGRRINPEDGIQRYKGLRRDGRQGTVGDHHGSPVRVLRQVTLDDAAAADELFSILMGEDVEGAAQLHHPQRQRRAFPMMFNPHNRTGRGSHAISASADNCSGGDARGRCEAAEQPG